VSPERGLPLTQPTLVGVATAYGLLGSKFFPLSSAARETRSRRACRVPPFQCGGALWPSLRALAAQPAPSVTDPVLLVGDPTLRGLGRTLAVCCLRASRSTLIDPAVALMAE
jgi:hypothetical protein